MNELVSSANNKNDNKFELSEYDSATQETGAKTIEWVIFAAISEKQQEKNNNTQTVEISARSDQDILRSAEWLST